MITINGKSYPLWSQFVEQKERWIGGTVEEPSDGIAPGGSTEITDISLEEQENGGVFFTVHGKDFNESFDIQYGGVGGPFEKGWVGFRGVCGGFRIREKGGASG